MKSGSGKSVTEKAIMGILSGNGKVNSRTIPKVEMPIELKARIERVLKEVE